MGFFGPSIDYELRQLADRDVRGAAEDGDFDSFKALKQRVAQYFREFPCPSCGNCRVSGSGVVVTYRRIHLYRQVERKGWFGRTRYADERYRSIWRIAEIGLRNAPGRALLNVFALLDPPPGKLECQARGCGWSERGQRGGTWSIADILRGARNI